MRPGSAGHSAAVAAALLALLSGWGAATADQWHGPCAPRFPGVEALVDALPTFACFTAGERTADGYHLDVHYSGHEHSVDEALDLAGREAEVFWRRFPYPVATVHIDTTAAFGESAVREVTLTSTELGARFGPRPIPLGDRLPDPPVSRTEITLWSATGLLLVLAGGLALRRR